MRQAELLHEDIKTKIPRRTIMEERMKHGDCPEWVGKELDRICHVVERQIHQYGEKFPAACAENGVYKVGENDDWTNGFWTGMIWMAWQYTGKDVFRDMAEKHMKSFEDRLDRHIVLEHHDIGFLYSLSVGAGARLLDDAGLRELLVRAAEVLAARYQEKGGFIQAWGKMGAQNEYRLIIDSLLNLPILYRAAEISGNEKFRNIADSHYDKVIHNIFREDYSTYHTFYFHPETGLPDHGATHQGFSDQSCWARGQAWAIVGMPLHARISGNGMTEEERDRYDRAVAYFESHLPSDGMPYWDLIFTDGSEQPRDSSALAVAACGMLENGNRSRGEEMVRTLLEQASTEKEPGTEGLLLHGVYAYAEGKGVDQPDLWGDYFYMEALCRLYAPSWEPYW